MKESAERMYGVDIVRIFAMYLVVVFHVVGFLSGYDGASACGSWVRASSFCCVDLFALISGYVGINSRFRFSRFVLLWVQIVFTGAVIVAGGSSLGLLHPTLKDWGKVFLPVTSHAYWYVTAYFFLFLLMPFLNVGLRTLPRALLSRLTIVTVVAVVILPALNPFGSDTYVLGGGLSTAWLVICYVVGGWLRLAEFRVRRPIVWFAGALVMTAVTYRWGSSYAHPAVFLTAVCYLMACVPLTVSSEVGRRAVRFFSSCAFGVYVWHGQPLLHQTMKGCFGFLCDLPEPLAIASALGVSLAMYLIISALEWGRMKMFAVFRIRMAVEKTCGRMDSWGDCRT